MSLARRFGRYLLVDKLATGGMAEIFEARLIGVEGFEKPIAIKQILPHWSEKADFAAMLIDEAKILVRLNHPNIVQVYELGKEAEQYYIAMELIEGVDLRELQQVCHVSGLPIPMELILWIVREISQALVYAHELTDGEGRSLEIIHRDISPQNILISYEGQVKVTDFGIAKATNRTHETVTGTFKGKFAYMSPEQANQRSIDQRSDLFSLGILFYELLTDSRLFGAATDVGILDKVRRARIPKGNEVFKALPQPVQELVLSLLSKKPGDRPASAAVLRDRLKDISAQLGLVCDRQDLSRFLGELLMARIKERQQEEVRISKRLKDFLRDEHNEGRGDVTRTAVSLPEQRRDATQVIVTNWRKAVSSGYWKGRISSSRSWFIGGGVLLVLALIMAMVFWRQQPLPPPTLPSNATADRPLRVPPEVDSKNIPERAEPEIQKDQAVPARLEEIAPVPTKRQEEVKNTQGGEKYGRLNVQAVPWGYVYAGKSGRRYETPLTGLKLPVGSQQLMVYYPPSGDRLRRNIDIRAGKKTTCIARFGAQKGMRCY